MLHALAREEESERMARKVTKMMCLARKLIRMMYLYMGQLQHDIPLYINDLFRSDSDL